MNSLLTYTGKRSLCAVFASDRFRCFLGAFEECYLVDGQNDLLGGLCRFSTRL